MIARTRYKLDHSVYRFGCCIAYKLVGVHGEDAPGSPQVRSGVFRRPVGWQE